MLLALHKTTAHYGTWGPSVSNFRKIAANTAFLYSAELLNPLASILLVSMIVRSLGPEVLGHYSLVLTLYFAAAGLITLGSHIPVTRAVAANKTRALDYVVAGSGVGLAVAVIAYVLVHFLVRVLDYPSEVRAACHIMMWGLFPTAITTFSEATLLGLQKAKYVALLSVTENVVKVTLGLALLVADQSLLTVFVLILILRVLTCAANLVILRVLLPNLRWRSNFGILKELSKVAPVFTTNLVLGTVIGPVAVILLSKLGTLTDVGIYSAGYRIFALVAISLPVCYMRAILPVMSSYAKVSPTSLHQLHARSVRYASILGVGAAASLYLLAPTIVEVLYGTKAPDAATVVRYLALAAIPAFLVPINAAALLATEHQGLDLLNNVIRLSLMAALSFLLIPSYGYIGAAWAAVCALFALLAAQNLSVVRVLFPSRLISVLWRPVFAGGVTLTFGILLPQNMPGPLVLVPCGILFIAMLLALGAISREERTRAVLWLQANAQRIRAIGFYRLLWPQKGDRNFMHEQAKAVCHDSHAFDLTIRQKE